MDDHHSIASQSTFRADGEPLLDSVDEQLRTEFAKLERDCKCQTALDALAGLDLGVTTLMSPRGVDRLRLTRALDGIGRVVDTLQFLAQSFGLTPRLRQQLQFWTAALESVCDALAKLSALLASSLQATLRTPLLLDGPELSSYKHRLR